MMVIPDFPRMQKMGLTTDMRFVPALVAVLILSSCAKHQTPVDSRASGAAYQPATVSGYDFEPVDRGYHAVLKGDTLYSIAWRYGLDYRDIARWNRIAAPYVIYPGQRLSLKADLPADRTADPAPPVPARPSAPAPRQATAERRPTPAGTAIRWHWPTTGEIVRSNTPTAVKGLDIAGTEGQKIEAAADGEVVYSGSGLLGYGKLIIIKHNETYLSAYAHNRVIDVKEGETVSAGQKIATMGRSNRGHPMLYFEIRKEGKPVDPLQYLPARS